MRKLKLEIGDCVEVFNIAPQNLYQQRDYLNKRGKVTNISNGMAEVEIKSLGAGTKVVFFVSDLLIITLASDK